MLGSSIPMDLNSTTTLRFTSFTMASLCTVPAIPPASQYSLALQHNSVAQATVQAVSAAAYFSYCQNASLRKARYASPLAFDPPSSCSLSRKIYLGGSVRHGRSNYSRRKARTTTCLSTTSVIQEETLVNVLEGDSSEIPSLNSKPVILSKNRSSGEAEQDGDDLELKPAPKLVLKSAPRPATKAEAANTETGPGSAARWSKRAGNEATYKVVYKPGDKTFKVGSSMGTVNPIDSLGQILEKAEKLGVDSNLPSNNGKENRYSSPRQSFQPSKRKGSLPDLSGKNSVWTKDGSTSVKDAANGSKQDGGEDFASDSEAMFVSTSPVVLSKPLPRPEPRTRAPLKLTLRPPPSKELAEQGKPVKRQPILRDVGAFTKADGASVGKPKSAELVTAPVAPAKFGKGVAKSKDGKEDWKKKLSNQTEGLKRRIPSRQEKAAGAVQTNIPGASSRRPGRKMSKASRKAARVEAAKAAAPVRVDILEIGKQGMSVQDLAQNLAVNDSEIVKTLFMKGLATTVTQTLDENTVKLVCKDYGVEVVEAGSVKVEELARKTGEFLVDDDLDHLQVRPPVVTIMGHVDHGKTSLLDYIRHSKVAASEVGGITQGIGAYSVRVHVDEEPHTCVFLDTPGHQAFSAMRARGARVTDIAIIVVAADDGVRPQTQEAIAHAKAANVPIVVAINKIDKEGAEPERVMQELSAVGLLPEEWGGDVPMVQVSALTGQNVDALLETVMLVAEFQELKANPHRSARGTAIEARLDKSKGVMATLLVQNGTLKKGDVVLCGEAYGKVRALLDDTGARVEEAMPSTAVQVIGLSSVPHAGDEFEVLESLDLARERAGDLTEARRMARLAAQAGEGKVTLSSFANTFAERSETGLERHQLNVVLKVDVQGSVEAIRTALQVLPQDTVNLRFLMQAPGDITASDVDLAIASGAVIIGFNVGVQSGIQTHAESKGIEIRLYRVIYELIDDIRCAMEGLLEPLQEQIPLGNAEVRAIFNSGSGKVAGCMVTEGKLLKGCSVKLIRGKTTCHTGTLTSLRRVREIVKEVSAGLECGIGVEGFDEWQIGDSIEAFELVAKKKTLEDASVETSFAVSENVSKFELAKV